MMEKEKKRGKKPGMNNQEKETEMTPGNGDSDKTADAPPNEPGNKGGRAKKGARRLISNLLIAAGLLLILVPLVISYMNSRRNEDIIDQFLAGAQMAVSDSEWIEGEVIEPVALLESPAPASIEPAPAVSSGESPAATESAAPDTPTETEQAQTATPEPQPPAPTKKPTMSAEEIQNRMTGVILVDKIDLRMVIMDGVDDETLRVAAGRMPETGNFDEVGNVVLAGHRSYTFGKYFNRLDELESGDEIIVQTRTKKLKYIVYDKLVIEPDDFSILKGNGKDKILTLFTCTPVVIADHRLVIHAKQVE